MSAITVGYKFMKVEVRQIDVHYHEGTAYRSFATVATLKVKLRKTTVAKLRALSYEEHKLFVAAFSRMIEDVANWPTFKNVEYRVRRLNLAQFDWHEPIIELQMTTSLVLPRNQLDTFASMRSFIKNQADSLLVKRS